MMNTAQPGEGRRARTDTPDTGAASWCIADIHIKRVVCLPLVMSHTESASRPADSIPY